MNLRLVLSSFSNSDLNLIIEQAESMGDFCMRVGVNPNSVSRLESYMSQDLRESLQKLKKRGSVKGATRHSFDKSKMLLSSKEFYYFLGYIAGDGWVTSCVDGRQRQFGISSTDKEVVEGFKGFLKYTGKLSEYEGYKEGYKKCYRILVTSDEVANHLMSLGLPENKSGTDGWVMKVEDEAMPYYLRGFCDSDGCVLKCRGVRKLGIISFLSSSKMELVRIREYVNRTLKISIAPSVIRGLGVWGIKFEGAYVTELFKLIYEEQLSVGMVRKRERGFEIFRICKSEG